jgi:hypothetical protein
VRTGKVVHYELIMRTLDSERPVWQVQFSVLGRGTGVVQVGCRNLKLVLKAAPGFSACTCVDESVRFQRLQPVLKAPGFRACNF